MSGWMIFFVIVVIWLVLRSWGEAHRWRSLVKSLRALNALVAADLDSETGQKLKEQWEKAEINAASHASTMSVIVTAVAAALVCFIIWGKV